MKESANLQSLRETVEQIRIANTHTHMCVRPHDGGDVPGRPEGATTDLYDIMRTTYVGEDMASAGLPFEVKTQRQKFDPDFDPEYGWKTMAPFIDRVRGCISYRSLVWAFQELYDFDDDEITDGNWRALNDQITARAKEPDWDERVIKDICHYAVSVKGKGGAPLSTEYFAEVFSAAPFFSLVSPSEADIVARIKAEGLSYEGQMVVPVTPKDCGQAQDQRANFETTHGKPERLGDILAILDREFDKYIGRGAVAMKIGLAYSRRLYFADVTRADAERAFSTPEEKRTASDISIYQNFMVHEAIKRCIDANFAVQFHTGLQAGPGNRNIDNSNPRYLAHLALQYPEANFDIFHGGYPYCGEFGVLGKTFANVYINTCWFPSITLTGAKRWLREWIETVPGNKILWGDDSQNSETCVAAVIIGKMVVAETLAEMVDEGYCGLATASDLAERILRRNALELYNFQREY